MLPFLRKKRHGGWLTVQCRGGRVELAHVIRQTGESPEVRLLEVFEDGGDADAALARLRMERGLTAYRCVSLLDESDYRVILTENPAVPDEELNDALRWRLKDAVDFPVADAAIATLQLVGADDSVRLPNVFAVAAARAGIARLMQRLITARYDLQAVDIAETALRNVAALFAEPQRGLGFLYLGPTYSLFIVVYRGELLLARRMELSAAQLVSADPDRRVALIERLGLDLQRTLDNFDRQFSYVTLTRIVVACAEEVPEVLARLGDSLYFPLHAMDLAEVMQFPAIPELRRPVWQAQCLLSIGAALREGA